MVSTRISLSMFILFLLIESTSAQFIRPKAIIDETKMITANTRVLAVMVEFQTDKDAVTVGDGTFSSIYSKDWGKRILDPWPHDSAYFANHLLFAKNYFSKVSGNKFALDYTVLPIVVKLSKTMRNYSPPINSTDFTPIADMMKEVWAKVDSIYPTFNYEDYDIFTIFHAGVGRDVTLPGSLGNERDIPSVYMGLQGLKKVYGNSFDGFPVKNNSVKIKNSIILPQTQNREGESFGTKYLIQLTFNGLLVSNIASHLGLPDLFNTNTGISAIGLFGLMDGQAIFAFNGAFPPAPSAWEKMQLGWINPVSIKPAPTSNLSVRTSLNASVADTTAISVPINEQEYFLIENRQRDIKKDGANILVYSEGMYKTLHFDKDTTGFYSYSADSLYGVIVDVDEYDWAVPGSGILLWHINNSVIKKNWLSNTINTDKFNRGVDVEEADGIDDIGNQYTSILGDIITGEGNEEDLWHKNAKGRFFTNKFDISSRPNSKSSTGANSFISISDFSVLAERMTFKVTHGTDIVKPIFFSSIQPANSFASVVVDKTSGQDRVVVQQDKNIYILDGAGNILFNQNSFSVQPVSVSNGVIFGALDSTLMVFNNGILYSLSIGNRVTTAVSILNVGGVQYGVVGDNSGKGHIFRVLNGVLNDSIVVFGNDSIEKIIIDNAQIKVATRALNSTVTKLYLSGSSPVEILGTVNAIKNYQSISNIDYTVALVNNNRFVIYKSNALINEFSVSQKVKNFSLLDFRKDGTPMIMFVAEEKVYAFNVLGAVAEYFPITIGKIDTLFQHQLQAFYNPALKEYYLMINSSNGVQLFNPLNGKSVEGFPCSITAGTSTVSIANINDKLSLVSYDTLGIVKVWNISDIAANIALTGEGDASNSNSSIFVSAATNSTGFLSDEKTYNYPNPVRGGKTYFRFDLTEDAQIDIKIFDLSGDYVANIKTEGKGGFDNEVSWDVSGIQSGIYLARIEATTNTGQKATKVVKVSVMK